MSDDMFEGEQRPLVMTDEVYKNLMALTGKISASKRSYNPTAIEAMWYHLACQKMPRLVSQLIEPHFHFSPGVSGTFYKRPYDPTEGQAAKQDASGVPACAG